MSCCRSLLERGALLAWLHVAGAAIPAMTASQTWAGCMAPVQSTAYQVHTRKRIAVGIRTWGPVLIQRMGRERADTILPFFLRVLPAEWDGVHTVVRERTAAQVDKHSTGLAAVIHFAI